MGELFLDNIYLVLLVPFWIFLIIMLGRFFSVYVNKNIIYSLTLLSSAFGIFTCAGALWKMPIDKILDVDFPFLKINDFIINCGLHIDRAALIFALVLFLVSFAVQIFSISYMKSEKKSYRFYAFLNLFNFSMAGLFFSPNLFQMYFFWELVGVVSYLLIGFEYFKKEKSIASRKVFLINRVGDTAFLSAILACSYFMYSYAPNKTFATLSFVDMNMITTLVYAFTSTPLFWVICLLFIVGALVKSAQFPFYTWLQDAMEAKLPVSALLHSATLVAGGLFLLLRLLPLFVFEPMLLKTIAIIGLLTALICSISACAQNHPKKVLAYSTSAQFGLMYFALGVLNIKAMLAFFIAHAFIKSLLFITLPKEDEKWNYFSFIVFLITGLSLSGILLSGMISKEMIAYNLGNIGTIFVSIISFLTTFYIVRIALVLYDKNNVEKKRPEILEIVAFSLLLLFNILFYGFLHFNAKYQVAEPFWASITAWICVYVLYVKNAFWKVPLLYPLASNGFYLDKIYTKVCVFIYELFANIANNIDVKVLGNYKLCIALAKIGVNVFNFVETKIMNGTINLITKACRRFSMFDKKSQTSNVQTYNAYAFIIITIVLTCLILGYTAIISYINGGV